MKHLAYLIFLLSALQAFSQEPLYPVRNFTTRDYGKDFHPANLSVLQDSRGVIYAANGFKLLEYDGHTWSSYPINREAWILSLASGEPGVIYAGSQNEFGLFSPDESGILTYKSLSDSLKPEDLSFTNIWKVCVFSGMVAFQSEEKIFIYTNGKIKTMNPVTSFHTSFSVHDKFYVRERGTGLLEFRNDTLVKIPGSEIFDTTGIFMMVPFGTAPKVLIGTRDKGFWIMDPGRSPSPFHQFRVEDQELFNKSVLTGGTCAGNGSFAVSTMLNGIIMLDTTGKTTAVFNTGYGLNDDDIKQVIQDRSGNLWAASNNGISTVEVSSPLSFYASESGINGGVNALLRFNNLLYAGTNSGLFRQDNMPEKGTVFIPVKNLSVPVRSMMGVPGFLLAGTDAGLYRYKDGNPVKIDDEASFTLCYIPEQRLLFSGGSGGLKIFSFNGSLTEIKTENRLAKDIIGVVCDTKNSDTLTLWMGTRSDGVIRLRAYGHQLFSNESFGIADGLPEGPVTPFLVNGNPVFSTINGLFTFIDENTAGENLPDSLKKNPEFLRGFFSSITMGGTEAGSPVSLISETENKIWTCNGGTIGYIEKGQDSISGSMFAGIDVGKINVIYPENDGLCWFGTTDGLIRYDENTKKDYKTEFQCLIRKVKLHGIDSLLYGGVHYIPTQGEQPEQVPELQYSDNSIRLEFAAPFYEYPEKNLFSYQINESGWSEWGKEYYKEFTNLREGEYVFRVKARNVYGQESSSDEFRLVILPPWYRTPVAYIFYLIAGFMVIWAVARVYSYRLKAENIRLEGIVAERTSEIVRQKEEIQRKNIVLEHQKKEIEDSIRYASRIQTAVMPSEKACSDLLPESFVFFRPLNIVSGDFFWISRIDGKTIFSAADCTGHGVPGAFMSMLGIAFLNEIVEKDHITEPDLILNHLRQKVIQALQHKGGTNQETRDGMDISLITIDHDNYILKFAGAYNPLLMIRDGKISEFRGDKMPVGFHEKMDPFSRHELKIQKGDIFYIASDGYEDQFGGPEGKKFKTKKFRQLLTEIHELPMQAQKEILERQFVEWKGELGQVDDIIVAGFSIT